MKRLALLASVALGACNMVSEATVVQELRVLSIRAEPPVVDATNGTQLQATVFDPQGRDVEVLLWTCAPGPLSCFEAGVEDSERAVSEWTTLARPVDGEVVHEVVPPFFLRFAAQGELPPSFAWALACTDGTCPIFEDVRADPEPGSDAWTSVVGRLADMFTELKDLPKVDTSAAFRTLTIKATEDTLDRPENPVVSLTSPAEALTVPSGGTLVLRFAVEGESKTIAYPFASAGGFASRTERVKDGLVEVELAGGSPDPDDGVVIDPGTELVVWVAFEADDGGSAIWKGSVLVTEPE